MKMDMKIIIPGWIRRHYRKQLRSVPLRSVTMKEADLDHLGALHQGIEGHAKRWWKR